MDKENIDKIKYVDKKKIKRFIHKIDIYSICKIMNKVSW